MKIVKIYLLILIFALTIIGVSCSSRFTPRKNDINNCKKENENKPSTNILDNINSASYNDNSMDNSVNVSTFLQRVSGATYIGKEYTYKFSFNGETITCKENGKTYTYVESDNNDNAVYKDKDENSLNSFWGLRLDTHDNKDDGVLYWSVGAGLIARSTPMPTYRQ